MKRRITKKGIRRAEKRLAVFVQEYLEAHERGDDELTYKAGKASCSMLASLLAWYLRLNPSWNDKELWVDGLINGHIHLPHAKEFRVHGEMVWGLRRDVSGNQRKEPFCAEVRVAKARGKIQSYSLKFGVDAPLPDKLVESGSYYVLLPKDEMEFSDSGEPACDYPRRNGSYRYCFSKRGEA
ncbi:MAG TPA: hypothetical protein VGW12_04945 [Pyrinomonadaceae bacterium]|nr:hypothetical protein [Pyrinomonadaceae bacterium]